MFKGSHDDACDAALHSNQKDINYQLRDEDYLPFQAQHPQIQVVVKYACVYVDL
jgi:hypothetical protein